MKNYYFDPSSAPNPPIEFLKGVSANAMIASKHAFLDQVKEPMQWDVSKVPTYCLFGDEDIYGQELVDWFSDRFKVKTEILKQCSHLAWIDQPKRLEVVLKTFYSGIC